MDKKTVLLFGFVTLSALIFGLVAVWFAPFQDSAANVEIEGRLVLEDIRIPLDEVGRLIRPEIKSPEQKREGLPLSFSVLENVLESANSTREGKDLVIGRVAVEYRVQGDVKNVEKIVRGVMIFFSRQPLLNINATPIAQIDPFLAFFLVAAPIAVIFVGFMEYRLAKAWKTRSKEA